MVKQDSPFWIDITMESEETEEKVKKAINACQMLHAWTMIEMRERWNGHLIKSKEIIPKMTQYIARAGWTDKAQRFAFVSTVNRAVSRFHKELLIERVGTNGGEIFFPESPPPPPYQVLDIQQRSIWKRYMEEHGRISTHYGSVFLEGEWVKTILDQSFSLGIKPSIVPYLIYSATLRHTPEGWQVHFNFHKPRSQQGKKRIKQSWE